MVQCVEKKDLPFRLEIEGKRWAVGWSLDVAVGMGMRRLRSSSIEQSDPLPVTFPLNLRCKQCILSGALQQQFLALSQKTK